MEHEAGSGWTGSPAQASDGDDRGNGAAFPDSAADRIGSATGGNGAATSNEAATSNQASTSNEGSTGNEESTGNQGSAADQPGIGNEPGTGNARVDAALRLLGRLPGLPVSEHPQLFEQVHAQLSEVLGELESGSMPGPAGR